MFDFIQTYFLEPIASNGWFNPVNTVIYSVILVIAVFFVYKMLKKLQIHIDFKFFLAILPFIFWGTTTRVLHDAAVAGVLSPDLNQFYSSLIFPTPGSYIITFALALAVLLFSLAIQMAAKYSLKSIGIRKNVQKEAESGIFFPSYWKVMAFIGWVLVAWNFYLLPIVDWEPFLIIVPLTIVWSALFYGVHRILQSSRIKDAHGLKGLFSSENQGILAAHFLDASATFAALSFYGYFEQHVLPRALFPIFGPMSMFALKAVVVIPVLYIIDRYSEAGDFRNFLKIVILILGLAPGLRDLIRLMAGV